MAPRKNSTSRASKRAREESETPVFEDGSAQDDNDSVNGDLSDTVGRATSASPSKGRASKGRGSAARAVSAPATEVEEGQAQIPLDDETLLKPLRVRIGVAGGRLGYTDCEVTPNAQSVKDNVTNKTVKVIGWTGTFKGVRIQLDEGDVYGAAMVNIHLPPCQ